MGRSGKRGNDFRGVCAVVGDFVVKRMLVFGSWVWSESKAREEAVSPVFGRESSSISIFLIFDPVGEVRVSGSNRRVFLGRMRWGWDTGAEVSCCRSRYRCHCRYHKRDISARLGVVTQHTWPSENSFGRSIPPLTQISAS